MRDAGAVAEVVTVAGILAGWVPTRVVARGTVVYATEDCSAAAELVLVDAGADGADGCADLDDAG